MKTQITLVIGSWLLAGSLSAQITITGADLPQAGYTYLTSTDTTPTISLGSPSASSQVWNFTTLSQDYPSSPTYGATSSTPYASAFAASNIYTYGPAAMYGSFFGGAPVSSQGMNKGYMFWKTDNTGFWIVGFRADSGSFANKNVLENPQELLIGMPATYTTTPFNTTARWTLSMNANPADVDTLYANHVTKTLTTDAWGSLTTPGGSFPNVLRIHEHLVKIDSAYAILGSTVIGALELYRDTLNNYIFMANNIHYPACIVHADKNNAVQTVEYYYATVANGIEEYSSGNSVVVFPNPSSAKFSVQSPGFKVKSFEIYNLLGECVGKEALINEQESISCDLRSQPDGMYFLTVRNERGDIMQGKLSIVK
jgi:hypothetical protein